VYSDSEILSNWKLKT